MNEIRDHYFRLATEKRDGKNKINKKIKNKHRRKKNLFLFLQIKHEKRNEEVIDSVCFCFFTHSVNFIFASSIFTCLRREEKSSEIKNKQKKINLVI